jgi:iron(III) transport system ATP-binding protein
VDTPIGRLEAPDLLEGMPALVCIRPEHVRVSETPTLRHGRLVRSTFLGPGEQLELAIAGLEAPLVARTRSRTGRKPGDLVYVDVSPRDALLFAHDRDLRAPRSME